VTKLLIADDHPFVLSGLRAVLADSDYIVVAAAASGTAALDELPTARPDILLLDVRMAGHGGLDVLRTLRSRGDERPVVLLTASLDDSRLIEALRLNVDGIVLKDTAQDVLIHCLDEVRAGRRWIDHGLLHRALDLQTAGGGGQADPFAALNLRERAIVGLVVQGMRNREIGKELGVAEGTVKAHLHRIYDKLGVTDRTDLMLRARDSASFG
jgi:two-component system nitrate/nitrite response regulator NarP